MAWVKLHRTDGGRAAEGFTHETNDCTVRALANVTGLSYSNSHKYARLAGRRNRHGMKKDQVATMLNLLAQDGLYTIKEMLVPQPTIVGGQFRAFGIGRRQRVGGISKSEFLWRLPKKGQFYCASTSHAFAVVDGVLKDHSESGRSKMMACWELVPVAGAPAPEAIQIPAVPPTSQETREAIDQIARRIEMDKMKKRIAELETKIAREKEMEAMKKRIKELEAKLAPKTTSAAAGR